MPKQKPPTNPVSPLAAVAPSVGKRPATKSSAAPVHVEGYSYGELRPLVQAALDAGLSCLVRGHPGIGKSTLAIELAQSMEKPMLDIRLAQRDPAEVCGVYFPNREKQSLELLAPEWVKQACDQASFVFLDEINAGVTKLHQAAAYQIVLEHRVGPFKFHPETVVMAAGNLEEDLALATPLSSALCNRFAHYIMRPDVESWLRWGATAGVDERILSFVRANGAEVLYQAANGEYAFPTPRSWEMASKILAQADQAHAKRVVAACVGAPMAERWQQYATIFHKVPARQIVFEGEEIDFTKAKNDEPSFVYAAVFAVAALISRNSIGDEHLPNILKFLRSRGLDPEYQILFLRQLRSRTAVIDRLKPLADFRKLAGELVSLKASLYV